MAAGPSSFFILIPCCNSTADMTLRLIDLHDLLYLQVKSVIAPRQPFCQILMNRGFGNAEMLCGVTNGGLVLDDVQRQIAGSSFHELLQSQHSLHIVLGKCMFRPGKICVRIIGKKLQLLFVLRRNL